MKIDHPKPYQFYLLFLLVGALLVFGINSCRKENIPSNNSVVTKALNGHGIDITRLQQAYQQGTSIPLKVNDISSQAIANIVGTLNVDWSSYTLQEFPDSSKIIEFPMPDDTTLIAPRDSLQNGHNKYATKTCAVFVLHKDTIVLNFFMKTVESLNAPGYQSVINQLHYLSIPGGFTGEVLYFTLGRQFINGYVWQNGSIKQSMTIGSAPATPPSPASQNYKGKLKVDVAQVSNCVEDDYELVWINSNGTEDPTGISWTVITCDVTNTDGSVLGSTGTTPAPPPCTTGSGAIASSVKNGHLVIDIASSGSSTGSSTPTPTTQPCPTNNPTLKPKTNSPTPSALKIQTDTLGRNFPCAIQILQKLLAVQSYDNFIAPFETSQKPDLILSDGNFTWNPNGGTNILANTQIDPSSGVGLGSLIKFNDNMLKNSSILLIEATFIHETLHAYINYDVAINSVNGAPNFKFNGSWLNEMDVFVDQNGLPTNYRDHYEMMTDYFNQAISILASIDNNAHNTQQYAMAMLYGLNNADQTCTQTEVQELHQEYSNLMQSYGISSSQLNAFWLSQLMATNPSDKLSTNCSSQ